MDAEKYLSQIEILDIKIQDRLQELAQIESMKTKITSTFGSERVQASSNNKKMEDCILRFDEMKCKLIDEIFDFYCYRDEAKTLVENSCDATSIRLLELRYFEYAAWETIAKEMHYCYKHVSQKLHKKALAQVQKVLDQKGI